MADELSRRGIPFVFTTGFGSSSLPERFQNAAIMEKPFRLRDIQQALGALQGASSHA